jgi:hypothetical protein
LQNKGLGLHFSDLDRLQSGVDTRETPLGVTKVRLGFRTRFKACHLFKVRIRQGRGGEDDNDKGPFHASLIGSRWLFFTEKSTV